MPPPLFREPALRKLSSPEQLDQLLRVTSPRAWLALAMLGFILTAVVVWSLLGRIDTHVAGRGILLVEGNLMVVVAEASGPLTDFYVQVGQEVQAGQIVAQISQPELAVAIEKARAEAAELKAQQTTLTRFAEIARDLEQKATAVQRNAIQTALANAQTRQTELNTLYRKQQALLSQRLIVEQTLLSTQQQLDAAVKEIGQAEVQLKELIAKEQKSQETVKSDILARDLRIHTAERQLQELETKLAQTGKVMCRFAGRVVDLRAARHAVVTPGTPIMTLVPSGDPTRNLQAILYVGAEEGRRIQAGMMAEVSPSTVKREKYGFLIGEVRSVSAVPIDPGTIKARLQNQDLVDSIIKQMGVVLEVRIALQADPATVSRLRWSSPNGPPVSITEGTLCTARVTVEQQPPIALVIPLLKKETGLD
jgi:HlyD family secretion protein